IRYFEERFEGSAPPPGFDRLRVDFDPDWRTKNRSIYLGVEAVDGELTLHDCEELLQGMDKKLGGATRVGLDFDQRLEGMELAPLGPDRPRSLPPGFVYYQIEGKRADWQDVVQSRALLLRFNPSQAKPEIAAASLSGGERGTPRVARVLKVN